MKQTNLPQALPANSRQSSPLHESSGSGSLRLGSPGLESPGLGAPGLRAPGLRAPGLGAPGPEANT